MARGQKNKHTKKQHNKPKVISALQPGAKIVEIISLPHKGIPRGVFLANHLANTYNLTSYNQKTEHIQARS